MLRVSVICGTRPEAIKLAPVILGLRANPLVNCEVCATGQHREMLDQALAVFGIQPDVNLQLMQSNQGLAQLTSRLIEALDHYFAESRPDLVLVQGDTTTVFCASLAAFYHRIPVGHVEAGLRTGNLWSPWPEEANRLMTSRLATLHFAPTARSRNNLIAEGIDPEAIFLTGNTVVDALFLALKKIQIAPPQIPGLPEFLQPGSSQVRSARPDVVLITGHRRENFGAGFEAICLAIADLAREFPEIHFVYPVHLNPNVRTPVQNILGGDSRLSNVHLLGPLDYLPFVSLMNWCKLILTDSGGVQEEAPSLGKPVLVMRDTTERPEAVEAGTVKLVGPDRHAIVHEASLLLRNKEQYAAMQRAHNPYGDGTSAEKIVNICLQKSVSKSHGD